MTASLLLGIKLGQLDYSQRVFRTGGEYWWSSLLLHYITLHNSHSILEAIRQKRINRSSCLVCPEWQYVPQSLEQGSFSLFASLVLSVAKDWTWCLLHATPVLSLMEDVVAEGASCIGFLDHLVHTTNKETSNRWIWFDEFWFNYVFYTRSYSRERVKQIPPSHRNKGDWKCSGLAALLVCQLFLRCLARELEVVYPFMNNGPLL